MSLTCLKLLNMTQHWEHAKCYGKYMHNIDMPSTLVWWIRQIWIHIRMRIRHFVNGIWNFNVSTGKRMCVVRMVFAVSEQRPEWNRSLMALVIWLEDDWTFIWNNGMRTYCQWIGRWCGRHLVDGISKREHAVCKEHNLYKRWCV